MPIPVTGSELARYFASFRKSGGDKFLCACRLLVALKSRLLHEADVVAFILYIIVLNNWNNCNEIRSQLHTLQTLLSYCARTNIQHNYVEKS